MMIMRELCSEHAKELRETKLFGRKPFEEAIESDTAVTCELETMRLYGTTSKKRINGCKKPAETRFVFADTRPEEH